MLPAEYEIWGIITGAVLLLLLIVAVFVISINISFKRKQKHQQELAEEKIKLQQAIIDKQDGIIAERERIITDLHDDVGATLSSMHIYGDLACKVWDSQPQESKKMIEKISVSSKDLITRMSDIIWSMKPVDEEKYTLTVRLKNYSNELLADKNIECFFEIDETICKRITFPEVRKNILLIVKEAMNNIAKYSNATRTKISLIQQSETILLSISDNGKGFDDGTIKPGNGIQNIRQRCKQLNGSCDISSISQQGVNIVCNFPVTIFSHS